MIEQQGILHPGRKDLENLVTLICLPLPQAQQVKNALEASHADVYVAQSEKDAQQKLQFHSFDLIIIEEHYSIEVRRFLENLPMPERRHIFWVLVGEKWQTLDHMQSFMTSSNLVINSQDLGNLSQVLAQSLHENSLFLRPLTQAFAQVGERSLLQP